MRPEQEPEIVGYRVADPCSDARSRVRRERALTAQSQHPIAAHHTGAPPPNRSRLFHPVSNGPRSLAPDNPLSSPAPPLASHLPRRSTPQLAG